MAATKSRQEFQSRRLEETERMTRALRSFTSEFVAAARNRRLPTQTIHLFAERVSARRKVYVKRGRIEAWGPLIYYKGDAAADRSVFIDTNGGLNYWITTPASTVGRRYARKLVAVPIESHSFDENRILLEGTLRANAVTFLTRL